MDLGIQGRWALVCGGSQGLGLACAGALAREGVHVLLVARGAEALAAAAAALAQDPRLPTDTCVQTFAADIGTEAGREALRAVRGEVDILVNNGGGPPPGDFRAWSRDDWIGALEANMLAPIALMRAYVDGMVARGFGRIVNITSSAVKAPIEVLGLSNGARSGLTGFVGGLARSSELAAANVTVNNLLPGLFDTARMARLAHAAAERSGQSVAQYTQDKHATIPARRAGRPEEFGAACAFLCGAQAGYLTGQNILLDGGAFRGTL
ncbi:SDR family oxidoreductase [Variovorax sp. UMC13]|uniref:SDR family oxidoreductase n=1 Tax=Variovorax sp. UMC13 TaxID=1862326 RepID=UPI001603809F|nr:SDR family oxidoreductase [Variovorax sp. UMC13]MBB1602831.1 3-oxoacyl-ACP reductase [Variovorax sp. UMC13]